MTGTYLALGDSYTIGEQVVLTESYPYQTVQLLRRGGLFFSAPEIVAKTGWTTAELQDHLSGYTFNERYDLVTLLIGVNNQYRGLEISAYIKEFSELLSFSLLKAGGLQNHVFVLSIPDWGITNFAADRDRLQIANEIDQYNAEAERICRQKNVRFINITTSQRKNHSVDRMAPDGLHPSSIEYTDWARELTSCVSKLYTGSQ